MNNVSRRTQATRLYRQELQRLKLGLDDTVLGGIEWMGAGYQIFQTYGDYNSVTVNIFDWPANTGQWETITINGKTYKYPSQLQVRSVEITDISTISGNSISEYQSSLGQDTSVTGSYNLFSASIDVDFNQNELTKSQNAFSRVQGNIVLWEIGFAPGMASRANANANFLKELDAAAAGNDSDRDQLFNKYGSHFTTGIRMGGRAVYSSATNKLQVDRQWSLSVTAEASYKNEIGSLSASDKTKYATAMSSFTSNSVTRTQTLGGDYTLGLAAFQGKDDFDKWAASIKTAPTFTSFTKNDALAPLWSLCLNDAHAKTLKDYFENTWAPTQSRNAEQYDNFVNELVVITGNNSEIVPTPGVDGVSYIKIPCDLNTGAEGDFIYLCYAKANYNKKKPRDEQRAVIKVIAIYDDQKKPEGDDWTKCDANVNKGTKGGPIYICYQTAPFDRITSIKDVTVMASDDPNNPPPFGFEKATGDLNKGAKGKFVYACITRNA
jgi:hypothetical protein